MKLAMSVLVALLAVGTARADDLNPPSGPVHVDDAAPVLVRQPGAPGPQQQQQRAEVRRMRQALRQTLLQQFDANGDGQLEPAERQNAIRVMRQMVRQLKRQQNGAKRQARMQQRLIRKYDLNHDGVVDQSEMPPGVARRLRRLDRNGDGWVDQADAP